MSESVPKIRRRRALRRQDARSVLESAARYLMGQSFTLVEEAETEEGTRVYLLDGEITLFKSDESLYPTLRCKCVDSLPAVIVDMGAIPFVCKGADVMAPGITEIKTSFDEGALVVVRDVKHGKAIAIGKALKPSTTIISEKKGKVIHNLHYVGDKIWESKP
jgi:PUA-domain protein